MGVECEFPVGADQCSLGEQVPRGEPEPLQHVAVHTEESVDVHGRGRVEYRPDQAGSLDHGERPERELLDTGEPHVGP